MPFLCSGARTAPRRDFGNSYLWEPGSLIDKSARPSYAVSNFLRSVLHRKVNYLQTGGPGMARHRHKHSESASQTRAEKSEARGKQLHRDWRVWLIVGLMLTAMAVYVLTLDESVVPAFMRS